MNPYSLPSFIGVSLLIVFGLSVILQNPMDKKSRLLCLLCLYLSFLLGTVGMLHLSISEGEANFWNKWPYALTFPGYIIMIEYAYQITKGPQRRQKILGLPIKVHRLALSLVIIFWLMVLINTDLIIAPAKYYPKTGWEHQYGPLLPLVLVTGGGYSVALLVAIFHMGIKNETNKIEKRSMVIAFISMVFLQMGIFVPGVILPYFFDLQTHSFTAIGFVIMCSVLIYGYMRMQWETIQDYKNGLEKKVALRTTELQEALTERNQLFAQLNNELTEAAEYVRNTLPKPITSGPVNTDWRFFPSTSLGGDAFGYHWIDDEHFALYLLDVSGHGVRAALLSVSVMNALRSQTLPNTDFHDPGEVLGSLNLAFPSEANNDMFFTMWYGVYTPSSRELTYASGGHPPALLFDGNYLCNSKNKLLRTPNYIIGGLSESTYTTQKCQIDENSSLYVFSDGVYEVEKTDGSMWRFQEFKDYLHEIRDDNHQVLDRLYRHTKELGLSGTLEDDFTILEVVFN